MLFGRRSRKLPSPGWILRGVVLSCLVLLGSTSCAHGGGNAHSLANLVDHAASYDGKVVRTQGTVKQFQDTGPPYLVLEDAQHNRVLLDPADGAAEDVGRHVVLEGCFTYSDTSGQRLAVDRVVSPAPTGTTGAEPSGGPCRPSGATPEGT